MRIMETLEFFYTDCWPYLFVEKWSVTIKWSSRGIDEKEMASYGWSPRETA
jgi:hypothetical protein